MNSATPSRTVAGNIRAELARHGHVHQDLADAIGLNRVTLGRRLSGQLPFTIDELVAVAAFFKIPLATVLEGAEDPVVA